MGASCVAKKTPVHQCVWGVCKTQRVLVSVNRRVCARTSGSSSRGADEVCVRPGVCVYLREYTPVLVCVWGGRLITPLLSYSLTHVAGPAWAGGHTYHL